LKKAEIKRKLLDLKARQDAGEKMLCPRCGYDNMKPVLEHNALSRHADIYVCDDCGMTEAGLVLMNNPLPIEQWACVRNAEAQELFRSLTLQEARQKVMAEQGETLLELFRDWSNRASGAKFDVVQKRAFGSCPGLWSLTEVPFTAMYKVNAGYVVIRFRMRNGKVEIDDSIIAVSDQAK